MFFNRKLLFIINDDSVIVEDLINSKREEFILDIERIPHTAFYCYLHGPYETTNKDRDEEIARFNKDIISKFKMRLAKVNVSIADDTIEFDKTIIEAWIRNLGVRKVVFNQ